MPYDFKSDVWSLGCVMYEMATRSPPFKGKNMHALFQKVCEADYRPLPKRYSAEFREIVGMMLQPNPSLRPTCTQLLMLPVLQDIVRSIASFDKNIFQAMQSSLKMTTRLTHSTSQDSFAESQYRKTLMGGALLETIKFPRMLRQLSNVLPQSNYESKRNRLQQAGQSVISRQPTLSEVRKPNGNLGASPSQVNVQLFSTPQKSSSRFASKDALLSGNRPASSRSMFYPAEDNYKLDVYARNIGSYASPMGNKLNGPHKK